ncbi:hypothetical protein E4U54_004537 [Claviceps lovelessii]|nr:hypothetical protein E4U54_004537 [Claviceps lovelessii]
MTSDVWSRRDSYPPTQIRLPRCNKNEPRPLLEDIDENPLTYFLTPSDMDQDMDDYGPDEMLFDAGIEDGTQSRQFVRSVSPSTLDGLSKLRAKAVSPDFDSDAITTDDEEDEDPVRFPPPRTSFLTPLRRSFRRLPAERNLSPRSNSPPSERSTDGQFANPVASFPDPSSSSSSSSSPLPYSSPSPATRTPRGRHPQPLPRSSSTGTKLPPRPLRLWRQPSPDVWSILEETEEELLVLETPANPPHGLHLAGAKPKKRVRFLLFPRE